MVWNSTFPLGSVSVKSNKTIGQDNTTYIEVTMGNSIIGTNAVTTRDHFWNVGANEDGRHRFMQSPAFTVGGIATDPVIGTGMDGVQYLKTTSGTVQWFHRNTVAVWQITPAVLRGTIAIPSDSSYTNIVAVPANVYGEIFMYTTALGQYSVVTGFFRSNGATVESWSVVDWPNELNTASIALKLGNGTSASGLNIRARRATAGSVTWNYIITYRSL